jgi:hypothetical protein
MNRGIRADLRRAGWNGKIVPAKAISSIPLTDRQKSAHAHRQK